MLTRVDIANYRGFKSFRMEGLSRVNLLVGKNNSGKTALAEAIHFVTSGGDPGVLSEAAQRRGEIVAAEDGRRLFSDLTHFFHGHVISADSEFSLSADNGFPTLTVRLIALPDQQTLFSEADEDFEARPVLGVVIEGASGFGSGGKDLGVSDRGGLIFNPRYRAMQSGMLAVQPTRPTLFVPTDSVAPRRLSQLWRQAVLDTSKHEVEAAIRLVADSVQEILYLPIESVSRNVTSSRDWYVHTSDAERPVPLGSFGDGIRRLMILALGLTQVSGGTLLVDEIDTGLHYSVMSDMWRLVVKKAMNSNIQVVATTHSWDCIEGLSLLCQQEPQLMSEVAVHKIDPRIQASVAFGGESILRMVKSDIDPR